MIAIARKWLAQPLRQPYTNQYMGHADIKSKADWILCSDPILRAVRNRRIGVEAETSGGTPCSAAGSTVQGHQVRGGKQITVGHKVL
jgi:hypothetical protein